MNYDLRIVYSQEHHIEWSVSSAQTYDKDNCTFRRQQLAYFHSHSNDLLLRQRDRDWAVGVHPILNVFINCVYAFFFRFKMLVNFPMNTKMWHELGSDYVFHIHWLLLKGIVAYMLTHECGSNSLISCYSYRGAERSTTFRILGEQLICLYSSPDLLQW